MYQLYDLLFLLYKGYRQDMGACLGVFRSCSQGLRVGSASGLRLRGTSWQGVHQKSPHLPGALNMLKSIAFKILGSKRPVGRAGLVLLSCANTSRESLSACFWRWSLNRWLFVKSPWIH